MPKRLVVFASPVLLLLCSIPAPKFVGAQTMLATIKWRPAIENSQVDTDQIFPAEILALATRHVDENKLPPKYGLPIIGFSDAETAFPINEAGVRLVPMGDQEGLVRELVLVLKEQTLRETLRQRNLEATERYFSWDCIADAYLSFLRMS
jgi:hypothetical protein